MEEKFRRVVLLIDRYLTQIFGSMRVYKEDGEFLIPWGSTVINIDVEVEKEEVFISISSPVALRVKNDKELLKFLLVENGTLKMCAFYVEFEDNKLDISLGTRIKFDLLNKDILSSMAINVGNLANEYSKEIIAVFGGVTFKEYVERERRTKSVPVENKVIHDIFNAGNIKIALELYSFPELENKHFLVGKVVDTGQVFISAEREGDLQKMVDILEEIKKNILEKDLKALKRLLKPYEVEDFILYNIVVGEEEDKISKLKALEKEIIMLTEMLMKGNISHEEYRRRIFDIERELGL